MSKILTLAPKRPARISKKLARVIDGIVLHGMNHTQAAEFGGMSRNGVQKALKRPEVKDLIEARRAQLIAEADGKRAFYRARAFEEGYKLMMEASSEAVRARMVEFFAGDAKVSPVSVNIDARSVQPVGYQYRRPGEGQALPDVVDPED